MRQNLQALRAAYHGGIGKFSWENGLCLLVAQQTRACGALLGFGRSAVIAP
jgi:hypothetical protein